MSQAGRFYGVGVGPGDPGLMTLGAAEVIRACPVLAVPVSGGETILALEIARQAVPEAAEKELLRLDFPMVRDKDRLRQSHDAAAAQVMAVLDTGKDVAMLNLGDPSLYATYSPIQERVLAAGRYEVITIPGVPSFCAVAARLNRSLTKPHLRHQGADEGGEGGGAGPRPAEGAPLYRPDGHRLRPPRRGGLGGPVPGGGGEKLLFHHPDSGGGVRWYTL